MALVVLGVAQGSLWVDNGSEFAGRALDQWASLNGVVLNFSRSDKPTDNADVEVVNGRLRADCLNASWPPCMAALRDRIEHWTMKHTDERPPSAPGGLAPPARADLAIKTRKLA